MQIRAATPDDFPAILALNEDSVEFLSPLTATRLQAMHAEAALHVVAAAGAEIAGFLLAFREGAGYDSVNYRWFSRQFPRFLYIDRVVVHPSARSSGAGTSLYRRAFQFAAEGAIPVLAAEFDVDPPNPISEKFHARFGFQEVGQQLVAGGRKRVSLQIAPVLESVG